MAKQARSQRTHDLLLDAAATEFARHGYANANVQHVADRTGLTKGALYGHFPSKGDIASALVGHLDAVREEIAGAVTAGGAPPVDRLRALACSLIDRVRTDVRLHAGLRLVTDEAQAARRTPPLVEQARSCAGELVRQSQRAGEIAPGVSPTTAADLVAVVLCGTYYLYAIAGPSGLPDGMDEIWNLLAQALRP